MKVICCLCLVLLISVSAGAQINNNEESFSIGDDVIITIDAPLKYLNKETIIVLYALPNGNTTAQTKGKKLMPGDDWHFSIQHIKAQTEFIRSTIRNKNIVVVYLENSYKSWPTWKTAHPTFTSNIKHIVDTIYNIIPGRKKVVYLNGHSGGGSFIFGYLKAFDHLPAYVKRISFIDSNYGYDSTYKDKIIEWLENSKKNCLTVFAYNDSIAVYNNKAIVTATGGTWHRSKMMMKDLNNNFAFRAIETDSLLTYTSMNNQVQFILKKNLDKGIYHTQQVEKNGFIHSILFNTQYSQVGYSYYGDRAYESFIR